MPESGHRIEPPAWLDDPTERLATIFYTSGTTGKPKGVECPHAGYVNLALSYADYFDLVPGQDASSLTSSMGYDGSISEMYSAWVSGCTVVLLTKEQIRSGPDLVPILREPLDHLLEPLDFLQKLFRGCRRAVSGIGRAHRRDRQQQ